MKGTSIAKRFQIQTPNHIPAKKGHWQPCKTNTNWPYELPFGLLIKSPYKQTIQEPNLSKFVQKLSTSWSMSFSYNQSSLTRSIASTYLSSTKNYTCLLVVRCTRGQFTFGLRTIFTLEAMKFARCPKDRFPFKIKANICSCSHEI